MKKSLFIMAMLVACMPLHAQKSTMYGVVRLSHTEIADSLFRINSTLEEIQQELDKRNDGTIKMKENYYYSDGRDKSIDSLYHLKWDLTSKREQLLHSQEERLALDVHLMNAGKFVRKAYTFELVSIGLSIPAGVCLGIGYKNDKTAFKVIGYATAATAVFGCGIGAYVCHFKSGQKLRLAANSITYSF